MSRPSWSIEEIQSALEAWDIAINDTIESLRIILEDAPFPAGHQYDIADPLPAAGSYDRCVAWRNQSRGWAPIFSDGTDWHNIPKETPFQADSTAASVADLKSDFNALLAKLRANFHMKES